MNTFSIGEVAIYVRPGSSHYGKEVTILSGLINGIAFDVFTGTTNQSAHYLIAGIISSTGRPPAAKPEWLRKKPRELDTLTTWDKCDWRPEAVVVRQ